VIGDLLGKRLEWERKKQQPKEKQHIKKQHNTHTTTIKNERKKTKEEKPRLKTKNRKEKK